MKFRLLFTLLATLSLLFTACNDDETWEDQVRHFIENRYPGATVTQYSPGTSGTKVIIRHNNITKEVWFNLYEEWEYTRWEIASQDDVPEEIISGFENWNTGNQQINKIYAIEKAEAMFYEFDLVSGSQVTIREDGEFIP